MATDSDGDPSSTTNDPASGGWEITSDERTWGILVHAAGFVGLILPFGNILAPLLVWLIKKEDSEFVDENGKSVMNFQLSWTIYTILAAFSIVLLIGLVLVPLLMLAWLILVILAMVSASNDEVYSYPVTIRFLS